MQSHSQPTVSETSSFMFPQQYSSNSAVLPSNQSFHARYLSSGGILSNSLNPHFSQSASGGTPLFDGSYSTAPPLPGHSYSYPGPPLKGAHVVSPRRRMSEHSGSGNTVYSFVPLPGAQQQKRPRRRYEEIERIYHCNFQNCSKSYGTLNHLNAHVTMQKHGPKRTPEEFKETRREYKARKKEEEKQLLLMQSSRGLGSDARATISSKRSDSLTANPSISPAADIRNPSSYSMRPELSIPGSSYIQIKNEPPQYSTGLTSIEDPAASYGSHSSTTTLPPMSVGLGSNQPPINYHQPQQQHHQFHAQQQSQSHVYQFNPAGSNMPVYLPPSMQMVGASNQSGAYCGQDFGGSSHQAFNYIQNQAPESKNAD